MKSDVLRVFPDGDLADDSRKAFGSNALSEMGLDASSATAVVDYRPLGLSPLVRELVSAMLGRGIRFKLAGNRLRVEPWSIIVDADRAVLREHREAIKALVRSGEINRLPTPPPKPAAPPSSPPPRPVIDLDAVGIELVTTPSGQQVYTHALGDDYAEQVMSGAIPLAAAIENERHRERERDSFRCARQILISRRR